jgi:hypothetical protein
MWVLDHYIKFIITARLPLHRARVDRRHLQGAVNQTERRLHNSITVKEEEALYILFSQVIPYILSMMIYIDMIVLDNFLQYLIYIVMIDLSSACCFTYKSLVMLMSYL